MRDSLRFSVRSSGAFVLLGLVSLGLSGCGSAYQPVQGRVVWKDNGQPARELAGSLIFFEQPANQRSARGMLTADGSFTLTTEHDNDGAALGEHTVLILEVGRKPAGGPDSTQLAPGKIHTRYATASSSDLRSTIKLGLNQPVLEVDRFKP